MPVILAWQKMYCFGCNNVPRRNKHYTTLKYLSEYDKKVIEPAAIP